MKGQDHNVTINSERITLQFGDMEPIVIPRRTLRTRLQLIEWVYRLTGWPGMNLSRMRRFIETVFRHHGWALPEPTDDLLAVPPTSNKKSSRQPIAAEGAGVP